MELTLIAAVVVLFLIYLILTRYDYTDQYDVPKVELPTQETETEKQPITESPVAEPVTAPVKKTRKPRTKKTEPVIVEKKVKATKPRKKKSVRD